MSAEKALARFDALKLKFPDVKAVKVSQRIDGILMTLVLNGYERPELFKDLTINDVQDLARYNWPTAFGDSEAAEYEVRRNGKFMLYAEELGQAEQLARSAVADDYEALAIVLNRAGQRLARYVFLKGLPTRLAD